MNARFVLRLLSLALIAETAAGTVFFSRDEALQLAFPSADRHEARDFYLTPEQQKQIQTLARSPIESRLISVYVGYRGDQVIAYAIFDSHVVRTLPETFLIVLDPQGHISAAHLLAFYEPPEYMPPPRWLQQFSNKNGEDDLHVGRGVAAITGSTLTARAVSDAVRRALAIYAVLLKGQ